MYMPLVQWIFFAIGLVLQTTILVVMVRRKLRQQFPNFFNYTAFELANMCILMTAAHILPETPYFFLFWSMQLAALVLSFAVLREVFANLLKPFNAVIDLGKMLFLWAALFLTFAAGLTALATTGSQPDKITAAICLAQRSIQIMQCGLLLLLVVFEKRLGISWRSYGMCIAMGIGLYAALSLALSHFQNRFPETVDNLSSLLGIGVLLWWAVGVSVRQSSRATAEASPKRLILQRWNEALTSYGYGQAAASTSTVESFLPGIEKTVDRVMSRKAV